MREIIIPYLSFGNTRIETPVGLSDLLEKSWVEKSEDEGDFVPDEYAREIYQNDTGRWVTKLKKEVVKP